VAGAPTLETERLRLRPWRAADRAPFAALNADPEVMEFFPSVLSRSESDAFADRAAHELEERGFGLWAVELPGELPFAGFVGLAIPRFEALFMPCVEVGWRLARATWGRGIAPEAGRTALAFGFEQQGMDEIVSFTSEINRRSRRVMEKLGMRHDFAEDFDHPTVAVGHRLRRHVLYRLPRPG
jgi:RimJ/RimL family protein N-acetyltransferase